MKSNLAELEKVKNEYYRCYSGGDRDSQKRATEIASENFSWVLDTAISYAEDNKTD